MIKDDAIIKLMKSESFEDRFIGLTAFINKYKENSYNEFEKIDGAHNIDSDYVFLLICFKNFPNDFRPIEIYNDHTGYWEEYNITKSKKGLTLTKPNEK